MKSLNLKTLLLGGSLLAGTFAYSTIGYAQETPVATNDDVIEIVEEEEEEGKRDQIIVTGSRIKRDSFTSIQPLQVLSFEDEMDVGKFNPVEILQETTSAAGTQIDSTFQGFVLDNGPGSETINLRGLGASRTLVLINGRRYGPGGVEGAPTNPSINLIPGRMIERVDLLLDGASSVYGSDAVAGVVNVVFRKDFEGLELDFAGDLTEQASSTDYALSATWGKNTDRGFLGVGVQFDHQDEVTYADRDFLRGCETHVEIDEQGNRYRRDRYDELRYAEWFGGFVAADGVGSEAECRSSRIAGRIIELGGLGHGSIYSVSGSGNIGIPGYIDQTFQGVPIDGDGDGVQDFGFQEFAINGNDLETSLVNEQDKIAILAHGEYTFDGEANITPYFEAMFVDLTVKADSGTPQLFPVVSANNPFNPCGVNGIDCGLGQDVVTTDSGFMDRWNIYQRDIDPNRDGNTDDARICATFGAEFDADGNLIPGTGLFDSAVCTPALFGLGSYNAGSIYVLPVTAVYGDRDNVEVNLQQTRLVGGFKGDIPFLNTGSLSNWSFETFVSHQRTKGASSRVGIRSDRLAFSLGNNESGVPCVAVAGETVRADVLAGCVPVNLFAESLYPGTIVGDFATAAERNYLFDSRDFLTIYTQTIWNGFMSGNLMELPAGSLSASLGAEYRIDDLDSQPDDIARDGLFFGFFSDGGGVGKKATRELFAELNIPIVADKTFFRQLDVHMSGRLTDDEFYGTNYTYSADVGWRPFDSLLLKATTGTSFRAPNLRENFLVGSTGFNSYIDPCVVPADARTTDLDTGDRIYDSTGDTREADTLAACVREGVDPTNLGLNVSPEQFSLTNLEVSTGGNLLLIPETSKSYTLGFSFEQPFFDSFDLEFGATYYNIQISESIVESSAGFIIADCFTFNPSTVSPQCQFIERDADGFIDFINAGFINLDNDKAEGIDFNLLASKDFNAFDLPMDINLQIRASRLIERSTRSIDDTSGEVSITNVEGEFRFPKWNANARLWLNIDSDWRVIWETRYIDAVEQDADDINEFSDVFDNTNTGFFSDTCGGAPSGGPLCRDVGFADAWTESTLSFRWVRDTWRVGAGITNIFDNKPPEVDGNAVFSVSNVPIGAGYDLSGRSFFVNVRKQFN